jgi:hypothetical protein
MEVAQLLSLQRYVPVLHTKNQPSNEDVRHIRHRRYVQVRCIYIVAWLYKSILFILNRPILKIWRKETLYSFLASRYKLKEGWKTSYLAASEQKAELSLTKTKTKLHGPSPRANYTDRATAACQRSDCQLVRRESAMWSAWRIPTAVFSVF